MTDHKSARLLEIYARDHACTARTARRHRDAGDPRWIAWIEDRETSNPPEVSLPVPTPDESDEESLGILAEIRRLRGECRRIAKRADHFATLGSLAREIQLHRLLDQKREVLRKLELSTAEVVLASGSYIRKSVVEDTFGRWISAISRFLDTMPVRCAHLMPTELQSHVHDVVDTEVARLRLMASQISFGDAQSPEHVSVQIPVPQIPVQSPQRGLPLDDI